MPLDVQLEALLFYKAASVPRSAIEKLLECSASDLAEAITTLRERLAGGALTVIETESALQLVTAPAAATLIDSLRKDDLRSDIGKAGAETLAIILYRTPVSRAEIDRIRGVNSSTILRNLLVRGLIERSTTKGESLFRPTTDLLAHLGISERHEMPDFARVMDRLEAFSTASNSAEQT